jgi:hypothetical protein
MPVIYRKPLLGTPLNLAHPLAQTSALWLMNEGSGNRIYDLSGNNIRMLGFGPTVTWVPAGLRFAGTNALYFDDVPQLKPKSLTVCGYVRCLAFPAAHAGIFVNTSGSAGFELLINSVGTMWWASSLSWAIHNTTFTFAVGTRAFVAFVSDSATGTRVYANGQLVASHAATGDLAYDAGTNFEIGSRGGPSYFWNGDIENCIFFPRALTPQEVWQLYATPYAMFERTPSWMRYVAGGGPSVRVMVDGVWKTATPSIMVSGAWKSVTAAQVMVDGTWRNIS